MATSEPKESDSKNASNHDDDLTLPEYFDLIFNLHQDLEKTDESTSSDKIQGRLREGMLITEKAIRMVNNLDLFSRNEEIEEISTNEVKFMLLSAYLGYFTGLNIHLPRKQAVEKSKLCYVDYLRLLKSYGVIEYDVNQTEVDEEEEAQDKKVAVPAQMRRQDVNTMAAQRNNKIQRFKEKKAMEKKLAELKVQVDKEHVDDEVKREFYTTQLKHWANLAIDEIDNCNLELQMLKHREEMTKGGHSNAQSDSNSSNKTKTKPFRPFILTKTQLQKQVFGAGYPAIPTMTVDEFYEQKLKEGTLSESVQGHSMQDWAMNPEKDAEEREKEAAEKEEKLEREDEETLQRARAMDEWKDDHRRGDGNRHNKG